MEFIPSFLNKEDPRPLYAQLYAQLAAAIAGGTLQAGQRLPGKRTAAAQLGVSVNTVDEAYQMLAAEGYVSARPRSGFVVNRLQQQLVQPPAHPAAQPAAPAAPPWRISFSSGGLDTSLFPSKTWNRLLREVLSEEDGLMDWGEAGGDAVLREAIAEYLRSYRGVRCSAGQLVVGAGLEVLFGMLARLFSGQTFAQEDPGYPKTAHILRNMGLALCPVAVDDAGMQPGLLAQSGAGVVYLTPSHQFPTGGVMPVGRRSELLQWAAQGDHYIIEDDYDSEFRFDGRPLPCMQGLDNAGRVVYAGTFSRSLAPGLRAAYLVLPLTLLGRWRAAYGDYACTVSRPEQHTLARLMAGGHFARSLNRTRAVYCHRRDLLLQCLQNALPSRYYNVINAHTGLYFVLQALNQDAMQLAAAAREVGVRLHALDEYRMEKSANSKTADALIVGYGGLGEGRIDEAAGMLAALIRDGRIP